MSSKESNKIDFAKFEEAGIQFEKSIKGNYITFAHQNLIVGGNGAGKTRFLKCLEDTLKAKKDVNVVTLYSPEINTFANNLSDNSKCSLYDILMGNEPINFEDFFKKIINVEDDVTFINDFIASKKVNAARSRQQAQKNFDDLNNMLKTLINRKIDISDNNNIKMIKYKYDDAHNDIIRSTPLNEAFCELEMSPGEKILYYFSLFIYYLRTMNERNKVILIIDEPEQHLHPQKLIRFFKLLFEFDVIEELWVASHSLFLVSLFKFESLILMDDYVVHTRSSSTYKKLYDKLVGLENLDIFEFLKSIENWQYYQFIKECFCLPKSPDTIGVKDEQFRKTVRELQNIQESRPLKVLDYGAGKCRIWDCLKLDFELNDLNKLIMYEAYEPYLDSEHKYDENIKIYTSKEGIDKISSEYDVIILMNVLHEIPVNEWEETFTRIARLLNDDGKLIFLEVKALTHGEQPYGNTGYLVLGDIQVKHFFKPLNNEGSSEGKSNCWIIPKNNLCLNRIQIKKCIKSLADTSKTLLKTEYENRINYAHSTEDKVIETMVEELPARKYAFYSQQYINAIFALEKLNGLGFNQVPSNTEEPHIKDIIIDGLIVPDKFNNGK